MTVLINFDNKKLSKPSKIRTEVKELYQVIKSLPMNFFKQIQKFLNKANRSDLLIRQ